MLDSLGGKQQPQSSPWFDSLSSTVNSNSSISSSSGSPPSLSHFGSAELSRPSWLFNSQPINEPLSTPTEALSSLLDTFSSPISDNGGGHFSIGQLTGSPYKQMASSNRFAQPGRRAFGIMSSHYEACNSPGAPGTPINGSTTMASVNMNSPLMGVVTLPNAPPPKNPKLYKTELCRSWMDHGRCNYGERCQYAHGEQEKRPIPRHPKYKTEACQSYHQSGYCPYGPRCHFIHSETDLLANLPNAPTSCAPSMRSNHNTYAPLAACSQQLSSLSFGAPLNQTLAGGQTNAMLGSPMLQRLSSLPGYGSTGESTAGSSSSADSGSESPNGSFSPGLDLDDAGSFGTGFMAAHPVNQRGGMSEQQQQHQHHKQQQPLPSSMMSYDLSRASADPMMNGLIGDIMSLTFDEKWERAPGRLPVFAQLSNAQ